MLASLNTVHWKGKSIDCDAYVLARPFSDKHNTSRDTKITGDANVRNEWMLS